MPTHELNRRSFFFFNLATALAASRSSPLGAATAAATIPIRTITHGPRHHWFGYYDKLQFDPSGRYVLGMEVDFEHRSPTADDAIKIGMVDLEDGDRWIELGESKAWCWQQGCMLQWLPGSKTEDHLERSKRRPFRCTDHGCVDQESANDSPCSLLCQPAWKACGCS